MENLQPESIEQLSDTTLVVRWNDDHESIYFADHLRKNCPCAYCENLRKGLGEKAFQNLTDINILSWEMKGRYALGIEFSDRHNTRIYVFDDLREICQCDICTDNVIRIQGPLR